MTVLEVLRFMGLNFSLVGDRINCGPKRLLTDERRELIRLHREEIMEELGRQGPPYPDGMGRVSCAYCKRLEGEACQDGRRPVFDVVLLRGCAGFVFNGLKAGERTGRGNGSSNGQGASPSGKRS